MANETKLATGETPPEAIGTAEAPPEGAVQGPTGLPIVQQEVPSAPLICRYWRGGNAAMDECKRHGITAMKDAHGRIIPGENTLVHDLGLGIVAADVRALGVCERGRATFCHVSAAVGGGSCPERELIVGNPFEVHTSLNEFAQMAADAISMARQKRAIDNAFGKRNKNRRSR